MKEFKYTIDGKEYKVEIGDISEDNVADVKVNGEEYKVQMEKPAEPEKKKVVLGKPVAKQDDEEAAAPSANINANNAVKAAAWCHHVNRCQRGTGGEGRRYSCCTRSYEDGQQY